MAPIQSEFQVFFSWESDIKDAHASLKGLLEEAAAKIEKDIHVKVSIDEATRDVAGSPDIVQCVTKKIDDCDVFVADISPVCHIERAGINPSEFKLCPNPNVMFELGYAVSKLGWNKVVLLSVKEGGKSKNMPFDINHNRTDIFSIKKNKDLTDHLLLPITEIIRQQKDCYPIFYDTSRLEQNIKSEKFIEAIYIDDYNFRQQLRAYVDPYTFYCKLYDETNNLSFDVVNEKFEFDGKQSFSLTLPDKGNEWDLTFKDFFKLCRLFEIRLNEANTDLSKDGNTGYINALKIRHKIDVAQYLYNGTPAKVRGWG